MVNIILITDTWDPQINGVVTTYKNILKHCPPGYHIDIIDPYQASKASSYTNIERKSLKVITQDDTLRLSEQQKIQMYSLSFSMGLPIRVTFNQMFNLLDEKTYFYESKGQKVYYHLANEGLCNLQAKKILDSCGKTYTSSFHTKFPEFWFENYNTPIDSTQWYFDWFHQKSKKVFSSSYSSSKENNSWNSVPIEVGIDEDFSFYDKPKTDIKTIMFAGRVSKEKNIDDFCEIDLPNVKKVVVGDGKDLPRLKSKYPEINFLGFKTGLDLVRVYQNADVSVFTSKVDTYGMVILEAMSCGTPVAAYDVVGARDQIQNGINGYIDNDLQNAVMRCFDIPRKLVYESVSKKTWNDAALNFCKIVTEP